MPRKTKEERSKYSKEYYITNKEKVAVRTKHRRKNTQARNREYIDNYLSTHPCVDCGYSNIRALDFDHVNGEKRMPVSCMVNLGYTLTAIQEEIAKCEVRCANCHRLITYERSRTTPLQTH